MSTRPGGEVHGCDPGCTQRGVGNVWILLNREGEKEGDGKGECSEGGGDMGPATFGELIYTRMSNVAFPPYR